MDSILTLAAEAARQAGQLLTNRFGSASLVSASRHDVKLKEDSGAQELIVDYLRRNSSYPILTEESGWIGTPPPGTPYWVVDPLDGSFNYLYGIPLCGVSIALCQDMRPLAGCVHDFLRDETLCGAPGIGLWLNDLPQSAPRVCSGILATGIPAGSMQSTAVLGDSLQRWRKLRLLGSAALSLSWLARGRVDAYAEDGIRWWDVAAGLALVEAVGGSFTVATASSESFRREPRPEDRLLIQAYGPQVGAELN